MCNIWWTLGVDEAYLDMATRNVIWVSWNSLRSHQQVGMGES